MTALSARVWRSDEGWSPYERYAYPGEMEAWRVEQSWREFFQMVSWLIGWGWAIKRSASA
jgi:hypothetical protein